MAKSSAFVVAPVPGSQRARSFKGPPQSALWFKVAAGEPISQREPAGPPQAASRHPRRPANGQQERGTLAPHSRRMSAAKRKRPPTQASYLGGLSPLSCQPAVADFIGSSTNTLWMCSHFGHSKVRRSEWLGPRSIWANIMRPWHLGQRGRSMGS